MWLVNSSVRQAKKSADPEFMPFPEAFNKETDEDKDVKDDKEGGFECLKNRALVLQFVKSPMSVNPCMSKQTNIYLQGEDRLLLNLTEQRKRRRSRKSEPGGSLRRPDLARAAWHSGAERV